MVKYLRKLTIYLLFGIVMYSGYWMAISFIPTITSSLKNGLLLLLLFLTLGLTFLVIGTKFAKFANNLLSLNVPVLSKTGILANVSVFMITVGSIWTMMSFINLLGGVMYSFILKFLK